MRVGYDAKRAFLNNSGLGNYSRNTVFAIANHCSEIDIKLFTPKVGERFLSLLKFSVIKPPKWYPNFLKSFWRVFLPSKLLSKNNIEIFHGLSNELPFTIDKKNVKSVVTIHDLVFLKHPEYFPLLDREIYVNKIRFACNRADKIIAISEQTKFDILKNFKVKPKKVEVIYQSISDVFFKQDVNDAILKKYNLRQYEYILSVGTIEKRKNQLSLLQAIHKSGLKTPIVFVGKKTDYYKQLKTYISKNGLQSQVKFLSNINEVDLKALYQFAKFSCYISTYEGFGLPIIESMACECPVLTSNISCMPETAGGAAQLCNPYDITDIAEKLVRLNSSKEVLKEMKEKGLKRAENYKSEKYANKINELYKSIVEN